MALSPCSASWFEAQHVFEPTSRTHSPGRNWTVARICCIDRDWTYQYPLSRSGSWRMRSRSQPSARMTSANRSRPAASTGDVLGRVDHQLADAAVHGELRAARRAGERAVAHLALVGRAGLQAQRPITVALRAAKMVLGEELFHGSARGGGAGAGQVTGARRSSGTAVSERSTRLGRATSSRNRSSASSRCDQA